MYDFTHLHLHTQYSLLDGYAVIDKVLDRCEDYGMKHVAITDHGVMFGVIEFYKKAKKRGIKPIIGCEIYTTKDSYLLKTPDNKKRNHLLLLAENWTGYQNLIKIVSEGFVNGYYYKPRVDNSILEKYSEGIICLSACLGGVVQEHLKNKDYESAKQSALELKRIFGEDNFFLELQDHYLPEQIIVNKGLKNMSKELSIPLVATNDVHYVDRDDAKIHDILLAIQTGTTINEPKRMRFPTEEFYFKSQEEMNKLFEECPEAIINTQVIAERCNVDFTFHEMHLPYFEIPMKHDEYLKTLVFEGLNKKYKDVSNDIIKRANFEIDMIVKMGFVDYFLIVSDFIKYAKNNGIAVGPGRGSAAGSIVSYALDITTIDPLKYDLLFERFLNPERVSMPDIDIDFDYERREEVIEYVKRKYGEEKVAQIVTFGTMAARNAIRDVGRVLEVEYSKVDKIAKQIPQEIGMNIEKALKVSKDFQNSYHESEENSKLIDIAKAVEGMPRHTSTHAAGVVIASKPVDEFVPLVRNGEQVATQYNMIELEELGLLKMDFLGLRNLTVIQDALKLIKYNHGIEVDIENINENDPKMIEIFTTANTIGVFQFESEGMRAFLRDLKPSKFDDLIAANSLFRPGPMNEIPNYIEARHNPDKVKYLHPLLESILKPTYGVIVYQEQVMQIVQKLAGFTLAEADNLRRAMGKKKMDVMEENRDYFVNGKIEDGKIILSGSVRNGVDAETANKIYDQMIDFAKYAFNKSHSAAYSFIAVQTAWLKAYYPKEYMAALLSSVMNNVDKVYLYIKEAKRMNLEILPPNINYSYKKFSVEGNKIRIGLSAIKTVGSNLVDGIIEERKKEKFSSFESFIERVLENKNANLNKRAIEALIYSGAIDGFGYNRAEMISSYQYILDMNTNSKNKNLEGQEDIFSMFNESESSKYKIEKTPEYSKRDILKQEKEYLGVYITDHPFASYEKIVKNISNFSLLELSDLDNLSKKGDRSVQFGGIITSVKKIITKNNSEMAFMTVEDLYGSIEVVIFPNLFENRRDLLYDDKAIFIKGKIQVGDIEKISIIANEITEIEQKNFSQTESYGIIDSEKVLYLRFDSYDEKEIDKISNILQDNKGTSKVVFFFSDTRKALESNKIFVNLNNKEKINFIKDILGVENVVIK